jgi:hypothetical protein
MEPSVDAGRDRTLKIPVRKEFAMNRRGRRLLLAVLTIGMTAIFAWLPIVAHAGLTATGID